jgi:hypothetical protein
MWPTTDVFIEAESPKPPLWPLLPHSLICAENTKVY